MFMFSKKKNPHETCCMACHVIVSILLLLAAVAALLGVFTANYDMRSGTMLLGSNAGSLSLIAFALCVTLWMKSMKSCMSSCEACGVTGKK